MEATEYDLEVYQARLDALIAEDSPAIFANYSRAHARCIIQTFLVGAQKTVDILAGDFGNEFYRQDAIRDAISKAAANGVAIRVVSLGEDEASRIYVRNFFAELQENNRNGKLSFKFARVRDGASVKHYMIVDGKRYRLEGYHKEGSDAVHAEVCCNGVDKAAVLTRTFDAIWDKLPFSE